MFNFRHNNSARRREVRRTVKPSGASQGPRWALWLNRRDLSLAAIFVLILTVAGSISILISESRPRYALDETVPYAIVPRVEFRAIDPVKTQLLKEDARKREPAIYDLNTTYFQSVRKRLEQLTQWGMDSNIQTLDQMPAAVVNDYSLTPAALAELKKQTSTPELANLWNQKLDEFIERMSRLPVLRDDQANEERNPTDRAPSIRLLYATGELIDRPDMEILAVHNDQTLVRNRILALASTFPQVVQQPIVSAVMRQIEHFYLRNEEATQRARKARYDSEQPQHETYYTDRAMIKAGTTLTASDLVLLRTEQDAYLKSLGAMRYWLRIPGYIGAVLVIALGLWSYILAYNTRVARNPLRGLALTVLLLICQTVAMVCATLTPQYILPAATAPTLLAVIVLAIAYDQRFAMAVGAFQTLLVSLSLDLPVGTTLVILTGVGVAVLQLDEVRTRSKLVLVGLWTGVSMCLAVICMGAATLPLNVTGIAEHIFTNAIYALGTPFLTGLFVNGILPPIERLFKVTTAMSLKDLNDASHPLLQRLAQEAPGTYQHSLRIGDMAEAAAEAVGADSLLCKVGAMYHDIGKINKPAYFVENQGGGPNRHNKLSPAMSLLIIVGHVKDGVEMAREYGLPSVIRHFIESHHGTTLVEYFYHAAKQQRDAQGAAAPAEFEYRYPGPKPQTREAAILMLCDGVEGAARALPEPTPVRLEQLVHSMAQKRLADGQFDECNMTLQDLHRIEQAIIKTLTAIYHGRIKYPSASTTPGSKDARPAEATA
jgi:putative nucleotidyltransferase with HDIG domain